MAQDEPRVSAADLAHALRAVDFPCSKGDLLAHAERNQATPDVLTIISRMEERQYTTMADVQHAFHEVKKGR